MEGQAHHIYELGNGESKAHNDHIRSVGHWPCPAIVASEQVFEQAVFSMGV